LCVCVLILEFFDTKTWLKEVKSHLKNEITWDTVGSFLTLNSMYTKCNF